MIPWEDDFNELSARVLFGRNELTLSWGLGEPMPADLADDIVKALEGRRSSVIQGLHVSTVSSSGDALPTAAADATAVAQLAAVDQERRPFDRGTSHAALTSKKAKHKSAVHGMGGVGKTECWRRRDARPRARR